MATGQQGNFFAIDRHQWPLICELGMNAALLYLLMARGSCHDNLETQWSAFALERYTRIARKRAKAAREVLLESPFVQSIRPGKHPIYRLTRSQDFDQSLDFIWLPNQIVTGIDTEVTAIERVRQTGDVLVLRLYVELFYEQNLVDDCGISRHIFRQEYTRKRIAESGQYRIWGFTESELVCTAANGTTLVNDDDTTESFFERLRLLIDLGLIQIAPYLCEGADPDDEIIHPMTSMLDSTDLSLEAEEAALRLLNDPYENELLYHNYVVSAHGHRSKLAVVGIGQTLHRPKTSLTAAGIAKHEQQISQAKEDYQAMGL